MSLHARVRARLRAIRILEPLANRDYRLLTAGAFVSLLGDGFYSVALAWQVYQISNVPTALSIVGVAWTLPLVFFLLLGGVLTDRYDRRWLMIGADLVRAAAVGTLGLLSITHAIQLWHVLVLVAFVGAGDAFFNPASTAIVPDLLAAERLPQANALQGLVRPLMIRLIGPALGGFVVAVLNPGSAFLVDAASFLLSASMTWITALIRARSRTPGTNRSMPIKTAPSSPPATKVACGPSQPATGAVSAKLTGTSPVETSQSRLETRPSRVRGTSSCSSVVQMIDPTSKRPAVANATTNPCHSAPIRPYPASSATPRVHEPYMSVIRSRGMPSCPTARAERIAPTPLNA